MTVGPCFTHDEYGRPRNHRLFQSGRGRLLAHSDTLTSGAYRDVIDRVVEQAGSVRAVRIEGAHGEPLWGVNLRAVEHNGKLLVSILNLSRETREVRLLTRSATMHAFDLIAGKEIESPLTITPLEPVLLSLNTRETFSRAGWP